MKPYLRMGIAVAALSSTLIVPKFNTCQAQTRLDAILAKADTANRILNPKEMKKIADSLGAKCTHCHIGKKLDGKPDYKAPSHLKETAKYMKTHFVDRLVTREGEPLTCATCHAGKVKLLPRVLPPDAPNSDVQEDRKKTMKRMGVIAKSLGVKCDFCHKKGPEGKFAFELPSNHKQVAKFMMTEIVGKYRLKDGGELACGTCHGGKTHFLPRHVGEEDH